MQERNWGLVTFVICMICAVISGIGIWNTLAGMYIVVRCIITVLGLLFTAGIGILISIAVFLIVENMKKF